MEEWDKLFLAAVRRQIADEEEALRRRMDEIQRSNVPDMEQQIEDAKFATFMRIEPWRQREEMLLEKLGKL